MKEVLKVAPWMLLCLVTGLYVGNLRSGPVVVPGPNPTPNVTVNPFVKLLKKEDSIYLSAFSSRLADFIEADGKTNKVLKTNKEIENLCSTAGLVVTLKKGPYPGVYEALASYFDEESEFPQTNGELTDSNRARAIANWRQISKHLSEAN